MGSEELAEFYTDLMESVTARSRELSTTKQEAFTLMALEELAEIGTIGSDYELCYFKKKLGSRGFGRVTAYAISEQEARIDLFTTDFRSDEQPATLKQREIDDALAQASRVFRFAEEEGFKQLEPASAERLMVERLHKEHSSVTTLRLFLLTNAIAPAVLKDRDIPGIEVICVKDCYDLQRHYRWKSSSTPYEAIAIDLRDEACGPLPCLTTSVPDADYEAYMAIVPGTLLHSVYEEYGARLMELNVRSYLQNRGKVNRGIRETILKEPHRFLAYNNGISATAEKVDIERTELGLTITALHGLQIVNGGQTVASIHRAGKVDRADLSRVSVQAKISVVPKSLVEELVPRISRFANTQNQVNEADFSANAPFHVEMELLSRRIWTPGEKDHWFYERARGQYDVQRAREGRSAKFDEIFPKAQRFEKTDLAKWLNTWDGRPQVVSLGSQKNFAAFMESLEEQRSGWTPDAAFLRQAVAKGLVFKAAESIARELRFPAYRATAVTYSVAFLVVRVGGRVDTDALWQQQRASDALMQQLRDWMPSVYDAVIATAAGRNVTEWAKKDDCWNAVRKLDLAISDEFEAELTGA